MLVRLKKRLSVIGLCIMLAILATVYIYYSKHENIIDVAVADSDSDAEENEEYIDVNIDESEISFSYDTGMYDSSISVELNLDQNLEGKAQILYTLNGDDPTVKTGRRYLSPINLKKTDDLTVYPLKAVIYYSGNYSAIFEKTYVICDDTENEFDINIVSVTSDSANLYDYETGIFVKGKTYDDYVAENGEDGATMQGNYRQRGDEWIRDAHTVIFDGDGALIADQNTGITTSGGSSAAVYDVKSFKIYAGSEYDDDHNKIELCLENTGAECFPYSVADEYNSLRMRSGSQDMQAGNIRSSVMSRLAQESGFDGITSTTRCLIFLNGDFYGIFDMQQNYSNSYLADRFGLEDKECVEVIKGSEINLFNVRNISDLLIQDLDEEKNREELEKCVDMDNYLLYCAIEILCNNTDWPGNNFEMWRYTGEYEEGNPYSDGRWRFLIYDTDLIYPGYLSDVFEGCQGDTFIYIMEGMIRGAESKFPNVMSSEFYRDKFVTLVCDLFNTSLSPENVIQIADEENDRISSARVAFYNEDYVNKAEDAIDKIRQQAQTRPDEIAAYFEQYFGLTEKYDMDLVTSDGVMVSWNNMDIYANEHYENQYYMDVNFELTASAYPGYVFDHWEINGDYIYDPVIEVSGGLVEEGKLSLKAVSVRDEAPTLVISALSAKGSSDWIQITNAGDSAVRLFNYYISDDEENLTRDRLPNILLAAGDSIVIDGEKNNFQVGDYICNFSLSAYETLILSDGHEVIDSIAVPNMSEIEYYGRYDMSGKWMYFMNKN